MDDIEQVRSKVDIVELIGSRIPLKKAGRNFKALCPFHGEKTPSFIVSPELQIFKCFGCGESGSVFSFLQKYEGMTFGEALRFLAEKVGIKLSRYQPTQEEQQKDKLLSINHLASEFYHYLLTKHQVGQKALRYLLERGITKDSIKTFNLGYAPDSWESLQQYLVRKKGYEPYDLEKTGLAIKGNRGWYDRFRGRVTFPLYDHRGSVIGFAGRVITKSLPDDKQGAKYINTPETALYHKSRHLFGLYQSRSQIKKDRRCIVVEGELDMISSWQAGVKNTVAIKGTALTEGQVNLLRRFTDTVVLALDADLAGDEATRRGIAMADKAGLIVTVIDLSQAAKKKTDKGEVLHDPDDIAQKEPKRWREMTKKGQVIYDYYLSSGRQRFGIKTAVAKKRLTDELLPIFSRIDNEVVKAHYLKRLSQLIDTTEEVLMRQAEKLNQGFTESASVKPTGGKVDKNQRELLEDYLLSLLLQHNDPCTAAKPEITSLFTISKYQKIVQYIRTQCDQAPPNKLTIKTLLAKLPDELKPTASTAFLRDLYDLNKEPDKYEREISRVTKQLQRISLKKKQAQLTKKIAVSESKKEDETKLNELKVQFDQLARELSQFDRE